MDYAAMMEIWGRASITQEKPGSTHFIKDKEEQILAPIFSLFFSRIYTEKYVYLGPVKPAV